MSEMVHEFKADDDGNAIKEARDYALRFFEDEQKGLPEDKKSLANLSSLEKLVEIIKPRRIKLI